MCALPTSLNTEPSEADILSKWLISVAYGLAVASDIILTGALVFVLQRSRTGSKR